MMNIVLLDGYTINPGDLGWSALQSLGNCTLYERTAPKEIVERARNAEIVLTNKVVLSREILVQLPQLKYIGVLATGVNVVDLAAAQEQKIIVTNVPAYSTMSVAQTVFALLLELTHHVGSHSDSVKSGTWSACKDFSFWNFPLIELAGKKFGVFGFGAIGQATAKIASALGMHVLVSTRTPDKYKHLQAAFVEQQQLFERSDVLSLHCALTEKTKNLVNAKTLSVMKPSALLINTSRGGAIDERALADALNSGRLAGAGLDVLSTEPPESNNPLLSAKNCIITPHFAWATREARIRLLQIAIQNIKAFIEGNPVHIVS